MATGASLSNNAENTVLAWLLTNATLTGTQVRPSAWYVGLFSDTAGTTTDQPSTELTGNGYTRQAVTFNTPASGSTSNAGVVTFTASGGAWSTANYVGIFDASATGNLIFWGALSTSKTLANGDQLQFSAGSITVSLD
jgi:hypothetical protein